MFLSPQFWRRLKPDVSLLRVRGGPGFVLTIEPAGRVDDFDDEEQPRWDESRPSRALQPSEDDLHHRVRSCAGVPRLVRLPRRQERPRPVPHRASEGHRERRLSSSRRVSLHSVVSAYRSVLMASICRAIGRQITKMLVELVRTHATSSNTLDCDAALARPRDLARCSRLAARAVGRPVDVDDQPPEEEHEVVGGGNEPIYIVID